MNDFSELMRSCLGNSRDITFKPYVIVSGKKITPDRHVERVNLKKRLIHLTFEYEALFKEDFFISICDGELIAERSIRNLSSRTQELTELGLELGGITFDAVAADDYFYHVENPRIYSRMGIEIDLKRTQDMAQSSEFDTLAGNRWADPGVVSDRIGASPYQPFPAILLSNYNSQKGLVHGTLSQRVFFHNYLVQHDAEGIRLDILSSFKAISQLDFKDGAVLKDSWYLGTVDRADDLQAIFARYAAVLRKNLPPMYGSTDINRHSLVWGSWNDGIFRDITQEKMLKTAEFLADNFPTVKWMQVDDGYAALATSENGAHGLGMPYEGDAGVAKDKFPAGLKDFTDKVRQTGLKPAVWIGGSLPKAVPLVKDHPDWFIDYSYRTPDRRVLDVSKPEVREYMCRAFDYFLNESGFCGVKHDFWSYVFEDSHALLAYKDYSGYQWRDWWLKEIRKRIPADGYLQTGCDIVMANPFLGEFFTNYRYGIDIGSGNWEHVKTNFLWGTACFALQIGDLIVPNSDSVGLFPGLTDTEAMLCINYCLISRSMVEIAGWLYDEPQDNPRFKILKKTVCCPNNGQNVYFAGHHYRETDDAPAVWYLKSPHFSRLEDSPLLPLRTVALFNTQDTAQKIGFSFTELGLTAGSYLMSDVWDNNAVSLEQGGFAVEMPPHSSRLFALNRQDASRPQLLDSNIQIVQAAGGKDDLTLQLAHRGDFEFRLNRNPVSASFNGQSIQITVAVAGAGYVVNCSLPEPGIMELKF